MSDTYLSHIKSFTDSIQNINFATSRVQYTSSLLSSTPPYSAAIKLYGFSSQSSPTFSEDKLQSLGQYSLASCIYPSLGAAKVWDTHPGKVVVVGFVNAITDNISSTLQLWDKSQSTDFEFFLLVFGKKAKVPGFKRIKVKTGTEELKENFGIREMPWFCILYESMQMSSGPLKNCSLSTLEGLLTKYSPFEAFCLFDLPSPYSLSLFTITNQEFKEVEMFGMTVIDFFNNDNDFPEEIAEIPNILHYKVYVGSDPSSTGCIYSLGPEGLSHSIAAQLKIFDLPCTYIFSNGVVLWKGNRKFNNISHVLLAFQQGNIEDDAKIKDEADLYGLVSSVNQEISQETQEDQSIEIDIKMHTLVDITQYRIYTKKFRCELTAHCREESDGLIEKVFNKLKNILPNLTLEIRRKEPLFFQTDIPEAIENKIVKPVSPDPAIIKHKT
jgi:hypothetical protein